MPESMLMTEVGLTMIFVSWTLTRRSRRLAIKRYGLTTAVQRAARDEIVPFWVSVCNVLGWGLAVAAGTWSAIGLLQ